MKKTLSIFSLLLLYINLFGQINFEPGYYINNQNTRIECLIRNNDWKDNPKGFTYKLSGEDQALEVSIKEVKEFGVLGKSIFIRALVDIDRSSNILRLMSSKRGPDNTNEQLFLRRLIDGDVDLYNYEAGNLVRFFYNTKDSEILQLVHKKFVNQRQQVIENNQFRQQLQNEFSGKGGSVVELEYRKTDLVKYFIGLNKELGISIDQNLESQKVKKGVFHISLMGGLTARSLSFEKRTTSFTPVDFGTNLNFSFGADFEFIFPFNKNKWAVVAEPSFNNYKANSTTRSDGTFDQSSIDFNSFEVVLGVRHYMFLNDSYRLFVNGFANYIVIERSLVNLGPSRPNEVIASTIGPALGLGLDFGEKIGIELRYQHIGNVVVGSRIAPSSTVGFGGFSMILNYQIF